VVNPDCGKKFLYLKKRTITGWRYSVLPSLCKTWSCDRCRPKKAKIVQRFIESNFKSRPLWMLSITYFHSGDLIETWKKIGETCNRLLTYAHKYSGKFDYVRIVEPHADGSWPHIHILCDKPIATERFVKLITNWGFGWNFHSRPMDSVGAASYVSKYLSKKWPDGNAELMRVLSRVRIVSGSRSLGAVFTKSHDWICINYDFDSTRTEFMHSILIQELKKRGCTYVISTTVGSGFVLDSDICLPDDFENSVLEPYIWRVSDSYDYVWAPGGIQTTIDV